MIFVYSIFSLHVNAYQAEKCLKTRKEININSSSFREVPWNMTIHDKMELRKDIPKITDYNC